MFQNIKLRTQLLISFSILVIFTAAVGFMGVRGIESINYQNRISALANRCLVDAQDVQAASLRFIIYKNRSYMDAASEESGNVITQASEAEALMLSEANKVHTRNLVQAMNNYEALNVEYYELQKKIDETGDLRAGAAQVVLNDVIAIIESARETIREQGRSGRIDQISVDRLSHLQNIRNAVNRYRVAAFKYINARSDEERKELGRVWDSEINKVEILIEEGLSFINNAEIISSLEHAHESIVDYRNYVNQFKELEASQFEVQGMQKAEAAKVMAAAREVRDGGKRVYP